MMLDDEVVWIFQINWIMGSLESLGDVSDRVDSSAVIKCFSAEECLARFRGHCLTDSPAKEMLEAGAKRFIL